MVSALQKGDEVITSSGILGKITALDEHYIQLNVASGVDMKMQRVYVNAVLPKGTLKSVGAE
jgi:preprotein translocase subunit YajC